MGACNCTGRGMVTELDLTGNNLVTKEFPSALAQLQPLNCSLRSLQLAQNKLQGETWTRRSP